MAARGNQPVKVRLTDQGDSPVIDLVLTAVEYGQDLFADLVQGRELPATDRGQGLSDVRDDRFAFVKHVVADKPQCLVEGEAAEGVHADGDFFAFCHRVLLSTPRAPSTAAEGAWR